MVVLIVAIILIVSLLVMLIMMFRKIPVLVAMPKTTENPVLVDLRQKLKEKIKNLPALKSFSSEVFIQKVLSKIRVLTMRIETKTANYLQKLREKTKKKIADNYWQELKKPADGENREKKEE